MKKQPDHYLREILTQIDRIELFMKGVTKEKFLSSYEKQYAVMRALEIMGEAVKSIPDDFKMNCSLIDWRKIAGQRDILIHHYYEINTERVWETIQHDLNILKNHLKEILRSK